MLQIIAQGRGGQGAQMAGQVLASAFFREGKQVQAYATYGGARRGTPVSSYIRVDDRPIRLRCDIENPDVILCFDASLLTPNLLKCATPETVLLVNSVREAQAFKEFGPFKIATVYGVGIASRNGLGRIVNSVLVGAFAGLLKTPSLSTLIQVIRETSPVKVQANINACLDGYNLFQGEATRTCQ